MIRNMIAATLLMITVLIEFLFAIKEWNFPDVKIVKSDQQSLVFDWYPQNFKLSTIEEDNQIYTIPSFLFGSTESDPGAPSIPWRVFTLGLPEDSKIEIQILEKETTTYNSIRLAPIPGIFRDKRGISINEYQIIDQKYWSMESLPESQVKLHDPTKFRDLAIQELLLSPIHYYPSSRILEFYTRIRIQVNYLIPKTITAKKFESRGKLDQYYENLILNFDQAQYWQTDRERSRLAKPSALPSGIFYSIPVIKDGLYKIPASTLQSAGIQLSEINLNSIQMFNNGGHTLSINVNSAYYNPEYTSEIPILVMDQNQNGLFDSADYILFYGKGVNSWFFDPASKDFEYHQHPYATENVYLLNFGGINGKRIRVASLALLSGAIEIDYFYDRYHFEEDLYNLLASGPDWYGKRFFGKSDSYTKSFDLITNNTATASPRFKIRLKGGSGITYGDDESYRYNFTVALNSSILLNNVSFNEEFLKDYERTISEPTSINNGQNTLNIQYSGNLDACSAYLDWFELYYPRPFTAINDYLNFYTKDISNIQRYRITNIIETNNVYLFDVSNPVEPIILLQDVPVQGGQMTFDLPALSEHKNLIVSSLNSTEINTITNLQRYQANQDLLNPANQADFLIITHKTFVPYAEQIAQLRSHLKSKVITMDDIYFNFNATLADPTALRNFIRYAYNNWQGDALSYVLLFGDGHYDYRNISLADTQRVPPFEIFDEGEIDSRTTDNYYVDIHYSNDSRFRSIVPDIAVGRLPMESTLDAERMVEKLIEYENNPVRDGWQISVGMVGDDEITTRSSSEWIHQSQTEDLARLSVLSKFLMNKIYLSAYPSQPGGFGRVKPAANNALIDLLNRGILIINFVGHGSPTQWAHESVFNLNRDLNRINNPGKMPFLIAATCDFGKYDDPLAPSFTEALIWKKNSGMIGALASVRLVYAGENAAFNSRFYQQLFPGGSSSITLGMAKLLATQSTVNDQKYHLFADPTMPLADPKSRIKISTVTPDTLKALSQAEVKASVLAGNQPAPDFDGGAVMIINDALYDSVTTGGGLYYTLPGPTLFKGELSVEKGQLNGRFIVPKSIRYHNKRSGRVTLYAWSNDNSLTALGYDNKLLFIGSTNIIDDEGPTIDIYFKDQENFSSGDLIPQNPILIATLSDGNGINMTGETGHTISLQIDDDAPKDISGFFFYEKNSFQKGFINYPLDQLAAGPHQLNLTAFDNLNNISETEISFRVASSTGLILMNVVNYPNPFRPRSESTKFTFEYQTAGTDAEVEVKIYTLTGRLIQNLSGHFVSGTGYHEIEWDGRDRDGDQIANGVYLYKLSLKNGKEKKEIIEKLVIMN